MRLINEAADYVLNHPRFVAEQEKKYSSERSRNAGVKSEL